MALQQDRATLLAGLLGLSSCTIFYSLNSTLNYVTGPALILSRPATTSKEYGLSIDHSNDEPASPASHLFRQWQEVLSRGGRAGIASAAFSGFSLSIAAYLSPSLSIQQQLHAAAAVLAVAVVPFTIWSIVPINNEIKRRAELVTEALKKGKEAEEGASDKQEFVDLLTRWTLLSRFRASMAIVAAGCVIGALVV